MKRHVLALVFVGSLVHPAAAELSCSRLSLALMKPKIDSFLLRPETTLELYPRGDEGHTHFMEITIRDLVASKMSDVLDPVLKLLRKANAAQRQAIGAALGDVARDCERAARPADAREILAKLKAVGDSTAVTAFVVAYAGARDPARAAPEPYARATNPLGKPPISSPSTDPFRDSARLPDPFSTSDPFSPIR